MPLPTVAYANGVLDCGGLYGITYPMKRGPAWAKLVTDRLTAFLRTARHRIIKVQQSMVY